MNSIYNSRGVSAQKSEVHQSIQNLNKGLYPKAFCKIYPDYLTGDEDYCLISHADGAGTKSVLAYLYWKETGDVSIFKSIAQDAFVMNTDDLLCVGAVDSLCYTSLIGRNKNLIPAEVLSTLINANNDLCERFRQYGINVNLMGGETADVGDIVRTLIVDGVMTTRMRQGHVIDNSNIQAGDVIIGLASFGQTTYEKEYNSGIGSNGITSARHDVLSKYYEWKFPEAFDPGIPQANRFNGKYNLLDINEKSGLLIGKLLLSPTRTYFPVVKQILNTISRSDIHGMIHCTGGGQTKILHFVDNLHIIKDNLFDVPEVFKIIKEASLSEWKEMYEVFNMGHRLEIYVDPKIADVIIEICGKFNLDAKIIGRVEASEKKQLTISTDHGDYIY